MGSCHYAGYASNFFSLNFSELEGGGGYVPYIAFRIQYSWYWNRKSKNIILLGSLLTRQWPEMRHIFQVI